MATDPHHAMVTAATPATLTPYNSTPVIFRHTDPRRPFYGFSIDNRMILCAWQHRVKPRFADRQTVRISIPYMIRDAHGWPRNDQNRLYDKGC